MWNERVSFSTDRKIGEGAVTVLQWCVGAKDRPNTGGVAQIQGM